MDKQETLEDLKMTRDEFDRITDAMKNEEFRKLFVEYCEEISDPENRKKYEEEIKLLESQRGVDCQFVHPHPGYVIKTTNGSEKVFINVASNELVDKPECQRRTNDEGQVGLAWSVPLLQAPPRQDMDRKNRWCTVYDVIFHPDSLLLAERDKRMRELLNGTALDAVCNAFKVDLDRKNLRFPRIAYKGSPKPTVIRRKGDQSKVEDMGPLKDLMPPEPEVKKPREVPESRVPEYTEPKHKVLYRKAVEMREFTDQLDAKIDLTVPREVEVEVQLPLVRKMEDLALDVTEEKLFLSCERPKYRLDLKLGYRVDAKSGSARFETDKRVLRVVLPILPVKIGVPEILERTQKVVELPENDTLGALEAQEVEKLPENEASEVSEVVEPPKVEASEVPETPKTLELPEGETSEAPEAQKITEMADFEASETFKDQKIKEFPDSEPPEDPESPEEVPFFDPNVRYETPKFSAPSFTDTSLTLLFRSPNIEPDSVAIAFKPDEMTLRFSTLGSGFFSLLFGMIFSFEDLKIASVTSKLHESGLRVKIELQEGPLSADSGVIFGFTDLDYVLLRDLLLTPEEQELEETGEVFHEESFPAVTPQFLAFESRLCELSK